MIPDAIDYEALKRRGFLKQKQEGFFIFRARTRYAKFLNDDLLKLTAISDKYGKGFVHVTTRQGIEIPFIRFDDIEKVEGEILKSGIETGTSGPRLRTTTVCPGNNWCKSGLINTFSLYDRIEKELNIKCGMDLPHKFKIAISGCPNTCTRAQQSEIGIHGIIGSEKKPGYVIYLGGCGGKTPRIGFKLNKIFSENETLDIIGRVVRFFKENAEPRQRLALLIEKVGRDEFLKRIGLGNITLE